MKGKRVKIFIVFFLVAVFTFAFSACSFNGGEEKGSDGHTHTAEDWQADETSHWKICNECGEIFSKEKHNSGGKCSVCGYTEHYTDGLLYELDEESNTYTVVGIGSATDKELVFPAYYNGKPVTAIGIDAFKKNKTIEKVTISSNISVIYRDAFSNTEINSVDFKSAKNLKDIGGADYLPSITENGAFAYCKN